MLGRGDAYMFQFLAVRGVDVEARDNNGNTALHAAVATDKGQRDGERVRLLVGAGIDVNAVNSLGETPLHFAAAVRNGRDAAIVLLELGADATARTATGASAMHAAVQIEAKCDVSLFIKALIAHGADVDARTNDGNTPLVCLVANTEHTAARDDLLRLLHKLGADINATNNAGETAFGIAADVSDMGYWTALVELGVDVNQQIVGRGTALHVSVSNKERAHVTRLLELGADAKRGDEFGSSPIWFAATDNKCFLIRDLVDYGGDCNSPNALGETPLGVAIRGRQLVAIRTLVKYGASVNGAVNARSGETPLTYAVRLGYDDVVGELVKLGAVLSVANRAGLTPLMLAVRNMSTTELLLELGADAGAVTACGRTALGEARRFRREEIAEVLVRGGATECGDLSERYGAVTLAADDVSDFDRVSLLLLTPYLRDWFMEQLELPDLGALLLTNHTAYRAVSAHWSAKPRRRFLLADTLLRLMCPSRDRERALMRRMMTASDGRWFISMRGEDYRHYGCALAAYDDHFVGPPAALLDDDEVDNCAPADYQGRVYCRCDRKGNHSATEPLFVRCAVDDNEPNVACAPTKIGDGWRLAACCKCGAQRPFCTTPAFSICVACIQTRPLMWLQWCAHVGVGNVYNDMSYDIDVAAVQEDLTRAAQWMGEWKADSFAAFCAQSGSVSAAENLSSALEDAMGSRFEQCVSQLCRDCSVARPEQLGVIELPYHRADGFLGYRFVALLGDSPEATAIQAACREMARRRKRRRGSANGTENDADATHCRTDGDVNE
jgi:ankyrin repeat protein